MVIVVESEVVEINYVGRIKNTGEIFDLTDKEKADEEGLSTDEMELGPVKVFLGEGYILEGLDKKIKEMEAGEEKTVEVPKEEAFGSRKGENIKTISKREFEKYDVNPRRGMPVEVDGMRGKILTVTSGRVKVDFNHPLAGRDLEYEVEVIREVEDVEEQVEAVLDFHLNGNYELEVDGGNVVIKLDQDFGEELVEKLEEEVEKLEKVEKAEVQVEKQEEDDEDEED